MKTILSITLFCFPLSIAVAQWIDSGNNLTTTDHVGIGTTTPVSKLNVGGTLGQYLWGIGNGWGDFSISDGVYGIAFGVADGGLGAGTNAIWTKGGAEILKIGNPTVGVIMQLSKNGDVGIGTTTPDARLTVKGDIHAEEVKVDLNVPGPDYVFAPDYDLPSLESIRKYISENRHLPEVPSAKEMEENGIDLGEMNMLLLKKIEELTLHILQQEEEINSLRKTQEELAAFKSFVLQKLNDR